MIRYRSPRIFLIHSWRELLFAGVFAAGLVSFLEYSIRSHFAYSPIDWLALAFLLMVFLLLLVQLVRRSTSLGIFLSVLLSVLSFAGMVMALLALVGSSDPQENGGNPWSIGAAVGALGLSVGLLGVALSMLRMPAKVRSH